MIYPVFPEPVSDLPAFFPIDNSEVVVASYNSEVACFRPIDLDAADCQFGILLHVKSEHIIVIHLINVIP